MSSTNKQAVTDQMLQRSANVDADSDKRVHLSVMSAQLSLYGHPIRRPSACSGNEQMEGEVGSRHAVGTPAREGANCLGHRL